MVLKHQLLLIHCLSQKLNLLELLGKDIDHKPMTILMHGDENLGCESLHYIAMQKTVKMNAKYTQIKYCCIYLNTMRVNDYITEHHPKSQS